MANSRRKRRSSLKKRRRPASARRPSIWTGSSIRTGKAPPHGRLANELVHVFVDDQNLFWGIVNAGEGISYRIDFGLLLTEASRDASGTLRAVKSAYIAGVVPDDDTFWQIAANQGFTVRRGYLGANRRSKQDDAYLITDMTATLYDQEGPSTIILVAGDADYVPPLQRALEKGWRVEVAFINRGVASALEMVAHEFRIISPALIEHR